MGRLTRFIAEVAACDACERREYSRLTSGSGRTAGQSFEANHLAAIAPTTVPSVCPNIKSEVSASCEHSSIHLIMLRSPVNARSLADVDCRSVAVKIESVFAAEKMPCRAFHPKTSNLSPPLICSTIIVRQKANVRASRVARRRRGSSSASRRRYCQNIYGVSAPTLPLRLANVTPTNGDVCCLPACSCGSLASVPWALRGIEDRLFVSRWS